MGKTLIIVESPAKAKTIGRYLGSKYQLAASVGHVRDLPQSSLGVNVNNGYKPMYITMKGKEAVIRELQKKAEEADRVLLATDPDREGEAIAWHLATILKMDPSSSCRVCFNEITKDTVLTAVEQARPINMDLVDAQQSRRILDRLVGYELSPLLWKKIRKGLSAGRVQSVATRLVVQKEREIQAFKPEEYWLLVAELQKRGGSQFKARYHGELKQGKIRKVVLHNAAECEAVQTKVARSDFRVYALKNNESSRSSGPPHTTSSLQQDASRSLNFSSQRTMRIAQQLYEGVALADSGQTALISYIRTDSVRISQSAADSAREYILERYGKEYLPAKQRHFKNRKAAQDAHEAIRPIHFDFPPERVRDQLTNEQYRLYKLIWDRFIASQMEAAIIETVTADIVSAEDAIFRVKGEVLRFAGWMKQYGYEVENEKQEDGDSDDTEKANLPPLSEGEILDLLRLIREQKFTQAPARYTEATLIRAMEELGIGRPSTYAPTIGTIVTRTYVEKDQRWLKPTELGIVVTELLENYFPEIVDVEFTAGMETDLDTVESGEENWVAILDRFYPPFHEKVSFASESIQQKLILDEPLGEHCPTCAEGELLIKTGRYGRFIACSNYPQCDYTRAIEDVAPGKCPLCGSGLLKKVSYKKRKATFYVCDKKGSDPECGFISWDLPLESRCEVCGSYQVEKRFRGKTYIRCSQASCPTNQKKKAAAPASDEDEQ